MNSYDFSDKVAVVTGGANGIGAAVAERLARSGARVAIWDMDIASPEAKVTAIDEANRLLVQTDVSDSDSVTAALRRTEDAFGKVDVLVNSAGIAYPTHSLTEYPIEMWRKVQQINVDGTFFCCKAVTPGMMARNFGRIVNIASIAKQGRQPERLGLFRFESGGHRLDQVTWKRAGRSGYCGQLCHSGDRADPYPRPDERGVYRIYALQDSTRPICHG